MNIPLFGHVEVIDILLALGALFLFFLIVREFWTWYWKLNKIVSLLEDIKENTTSENKKTQPPPDQPKALNPLRDCLGGHFLVVIE